MKKNQRTKRKEAMLHALTALIDNEAAGDLLPKKSTYNPQTSRHGLAAKVWELLRRHPGFRICAYNLQAIRRKRTWKSDLQKAFGQIDAVNPLAGFALRWLFVPELQLFASQPIQQRFMAGTMKACHWRAVDFTRLFEADPIDAIPELLSDDLRLTSAILKNRGFGPEPFGPLGNVFPGPMELRTGPWTLDTPWPGTPDVFRFLFFCLWNEYVPGVQSSLDAQLAIVRGRRAYAFGVDWRFLSDKKPLTPTARLELTRLKQFLERHDIIAIPHVLLQKKQRQLLLQLIKKHVDSIGAVVPYVHTSKFRNFLGAEKDWTIFDLATSRIRYFPYSDARTGSITFKRDLGVQKELHSIATDWEKTKAGDHSAHVMNSFEKMERLMLATFPVFDFSKLVEVDLEIKGPGVISSEEIGQEGALETLHYITAAKLFEVALRPEVKELWDARIHKRNPKGFST